MSKVVFNISAQQFLKLYKKDAKNFKYTKIINDEETSVIKYYLQVKKNDEYYNFMLTAKNEKINRKISNNKFAFLKITEKKEYKSKEDSDLFKVLNIINNISKEVSKAKNCEYKSIVDEYEGKKTAQIKLNYFNEMQDFILKYNNVVIESKLLELNKYIKFGSKIDFIKIGGFKLSQKNDIIYNNLSVKSIELTKENKIIDWEDDE